MPLRPSDLQGHYINLDRAGERRRQMERTIADAQDEESFDVDAFIASQLVYRRLSQSL